MECYIFVGLNNSQVANGCHSCFGGCITLPVMGSRGSNPVLTSIKLKVMKQETLEEAAERTYQKGLQDDIDLSFYDGVRLGAKWQAERMYSEEEVEQIFNIGQMIKNYGDYKPYTFKEALEQFKKK